MCARHASPLQALLVDDSFDGELFPNEPMSKHTTYRIGGPVKYLAHVHSVSALRRVVDACTAMDVAWVVVGRGSNLLVSDNGYDGVVITLGRDFKSVRFDEEASRLYAGAGALLSNAVHEAFRRSYSGLEYAVGTPGTIGGALRMNAGTRDEWIGSHVISVTSFVPGKGLVMRDGSQIEWGYRSSSIPADEILVECEIALKPADPFFLHGKMEGSLARRKKSQPLDKPSCGSVFRNPEGMYVAELIEKLGLKGRSIGGASVSELHSNFIVNAGGASAADVRALMALIQTEVREAYGIELTPEVRFLGFE